MSNKWQQMYPDRKRESNAQHARRKRGGLKWGLMRCPICGRQVGKARGGVMTSTHKDQWGRWCGK